MFAVNLLWGGYKILVAMAENVLDAIVLCARLQEEQPEVQFAFEEIH